jgi:hypothetical protein
MSIPFTPYTKLLHTLSLIHGLLQRRGRSDNNDFLKRLQQWLRGQGWNAAKTRPGEGLSTTTNESRYYFEGPRNSISKDLRVKTDYI